jgi:hypothetical protein
VGVDGWVEGWVEAVVAARGEGREEMARRAAVDGASAAQRPAWCDLGVLKRVGL